MTVVPVLIGQAFSPEGAWQTSHSPFPTLPVVTFLGYGCRKKIPQNTSLILTSFLVVLPAAERAEAGFFGLLPVWRAAGSRRPEEQQAEPAGRQLVEPQPQTRILRDSRIGEFSLTRSPPAHIHLCNPASPTAGSDAGVHQTPGSAARHDPPDRHGAEVDPAVAHLSVKQLISSLSEGIRNKHFGNFGAQYFQ